MPALGRPDDGGADAGFQDPAPPAGVQQIRQMMIGGLERLGDLSGSHVLNVLIRVVHHGVKPGGHVQQGLLDGLQTAAEAALELGGGVPGGGGGLGVDEVNDRLRLGQVQPAVQKGPFGELAGQGLSGSGGKQGGEKFPQHHRGAVAVELGAVLSGKAAGAGEADRQPLVQQAALTVQHLAEDQRPGGLVREGERVGGPEDPAAQGKAPRPGHPDDAHAGDAASGGDGGDDVHQISSFSMR